MRSRRASIVGTVSSATRSRPPGVALARKLRAEIDPHGWIPGEILLGRGSGWSIAFRRGADRIELAVAVADESADAWAVQIAPARLPGPIARALGRTPSATRADVLELARAAHAVLASDERFAGVRWRWDAFADEASAPRADRAAGVAAAAAPDGDGGRLESAENGSAPVDHSARDHLESADMVIDVAPLQTDWLWIVRPRASLRASEVAMAHSRH